MGTDKEDADAIINEQFAVNSYPNPTTGMLHIEIVNCKGNEGKISLYNPLGQLVLEKNISIEQGKAQEIFDLGHLAQGTYMLSFKSDEQQIIQKVVKE